MSGCAGERSYHGKGRGRRGDHPTSQGCEGVSTPNLVSWLRERREKGVLATPRGRSVKPWEGGKGVEYFRTVV